jgi:2-amino-4-hydroxy-6-hydroxymethyldihydropteridine diphosphokinase
MFFPAYIGLGANLGDPIATLQSAVNALRQTPGIRLVTASSLYRSTALGPAGQPDYINAVAHLSTSLTPHELLAALQRIENQHGRTREVRWGARTLDLDLLLYANDEIHTSSLIIPHIELKNRNFVVIPLLEISPNLVLPDATVIATLTVAHNPTGLERLHSPAIPPIDGN